MKIISFMSTDQQARFGLVKNDGVIDLTNKFGSTCKSLKDLISAGKIVDIKKFADMPIDFAFDKITFLPVIPNPDKIICVGMNYEEKRQEFHETDTSPTLFIRFPDSQVGHEGYLLKPKESNQFDYEGELAIIVGKTARHINQAEAYDYIAGYSCYMDGSVRDWQHAWFTAGKNWPATGGFGPWMVTSDAIKEPDNLLISTFINGKRFQHDVTKKMVHPIPELVSYISRFTKLSAGDVILTGSPGGVGKSLTPPMYLKESDVVEIEIEHIGKLRNTVKTSEF